MVNFEDDILIAIKTHDDLHYALDDAVHMPFGTEYAIVVKNFSPRKLSAEFAINWIVVSDPVTVTTGETVEIINGDGSWFKFLPFYETDEDYSDDSNFIRINLTTMANKSKEYSTYKWGDEIKHIPHSNGFYDGTEIKFTKVIQLSGRDANGNLIKSAGKTNRRVCLHCGSVL